ncbi:MAG: hypothetical protein HYY17_15465 [Planctomycetes bacterium]|nr:hypothetical protein [Planctomycetota bacterium]
MEAAILRLYITGPVILVLLAALQEPVLTEAGAKEIDSFGADRRLVAAYCWKPSPRDFEEMARAGVDVALVALSGGAPEAAAAPKVALFCDAEPAYDAIRGFFAKISPGSWAAIEGRPVVWLGPSVRAWSFAERFRADFRGRAPYLVAEWTADKIPAERRYAWGAAREGPRDFDVVSVGPGFKGVRDRAKGAFYERSWCAALRSRPAMVAIETWNRFEDDSQICECDAYGRAYVEATARFAQKYRKGETIAGPRGLASRFKRVGFNLKYSTDALGLAPVKNEDGPFELVEVTGLRLLVTKGKGDGWRRLYLDVDDAFAFWERRSFVVEVEYLDAGEGLFSLEYDSADAAIAPPGRWHKSAGERAFRGTNSLQVAEFELPDAFFGNRQKGGADFRLSVRGRGLSVRRVIVRPK